MSNLRIRTQLIEPAHGYTQSSQPWRLDENRAAFGATSKGKKYGWRLFHYLSGGGMRAFGRTIQQEERNSRQSRFLWGCLIVAIGWLLLWAW